MHWAGPLYPGLVACFYILCSTISIHHPSRLAFPYLDSFFPISVLESNYNDTRCFKMHRCGFLSFSDDVSRFRTTAVGRVHVVCMSLG
ncbi:hypothetical protein BKA62DRAFT_25439 [Auriculariales sp. MPI-PUGE-AT-0066]|nr:hypothetical protein BKA62DRAFT_25439 [Auriculariales sp. MPI-PUGE-AT-0066]